MLKPLYPFGMQMPGRSFSSGSYRYGFNSQEQDNEIYGTGNSYTAEFWQYDSRLGRRWNVDPVVKNSEGSYISFSNNPISYIDPKGLDTIRVNKKGVVIKISLADGNHVLLDQNDRQINLNDPEYDTELIDKREIQVGDKLVFFLSELRTKELVDGQGKIYNRLIAKALGEMSSAGAYFLQKALRELKEKSYTDWDFSHMVLARLVTADFNSNWGETNRNRYRARRYKDDYLYEQYYYFVFGDSKTTYNLADAGNYMWGMAGQRSGFTLIELVIGSNWNEISKGRGRDTKADQRAIRDGYKNGR